MAKLQPPLAEVRAAVKTVRRSRTKDRTKGDAYDAPGPYIMSWQVDPEDVAIVDAFLNGPMGGRDVVLRILTLEQGWTAPRCDPNVSPEEAQVDDELSELRRSYVRLMQATEADETPAPNSAAG